jgi:hypothetical protein
MGMLMKFLLAAGVLLFVGMGSTQAQSLSNVGSIGGGSSLNGSSSVNHSASANTGGGSNSLPLSGPRPSKNVEGTNPGEFVPSTFESYDAALSLGEIAKRMHPLSIVEAARSAQQAKANLAAKPALVLEKDADGNLIVVPPSVPASIPASAPTNAPANVSPTVPANVQPASPVNNSPKLHLRQPPRDA